MKFHDDISNMNTHTHTDKPKPICPPLFQSWGHNYCMVQPIVSIFNLGNAVADSVASLKLIISFSCVILRKLR